MQRDLFGDRYPNRPGVVAGSDTSIDAADSLDASTLSRLRGAVFNMIAASADGMTCDEIEVALNGRHQTISARVRELVLGALIEDTGRRRLTRSKRTARVYLCKRGNSDGRETEKP